MRWKFKENMFGQQEPSCITIPTNSILLQCADIWKKKRLSAVIKTVKHASACLIYRIKLR